jgi:hypothetical protein
MHPAPKETAMHKDPMLPPRQQSLAFAEDEVWQRLPSDVRSQCHERIAQLVEAVMHAARQERSHGDEREDST